MSWKMTTGVSLVALMITASGGQPTLAQDTAVRGSTTQDRRVPTFEVDPSWPPLPNDWVLGQVSSVTVDARDHVWVLHRPRTVPDEQQADAAPPVLEFDDAGRFVQGWGGPGEGYEWPRRPHGIHVDDRGHVWIGGYHPSDDMLLKFTTEGKLLLQIGRRGQSGGNTDTTNLHRPAEAFVYPETNEVFVADGYGNRRVIVLDADTGVFKRMWGGFGNAPLDRRTPTRLELVWVDRQGRQEALDAERRPYRVPRLSPDGTRVAFVAINGERFDLEIYSLDRQTSRRLTVDAGFNGVPVWTPDGSRIVFSSTREGRPQNLFWMAADGTGAVERLTTSESRQLPMAVSSDGTQVVYMEAGQGPVNIGVLSLEGERRAELLFAGVQPALSADGNWLAYQSNESGRPEVYVRPFPDVDGGQWQVSTGGGRLPVWAPDGRELLYRAGQRMMVVPVQTGSTFSAGNPEVLFEGNDTNPTFVRSFDIAPDGQRFLMLRDPEVDQQFGSRVHGIEVSNDGLVYVGDRQNSRVQVFTIDGTYVRQVLINQNEGDPRTAYGLAFSPDPQQQFMYVADGGNSHIHVVDRQTLDVLDTFGSRGREPGKFRTLHHIAVDSQGNLYTAETGRGRRAQKFVFKGMAPARR